MCIYIYSHLYTRTIYTQYVCREKNILHCKQLSDALMEDPQEKYQQGEVLHCLTKLLMLPIMSVHVVNLKTQNQFILHPIWWDDWDLTSFQHISIMFFPFSFSILTCCYNRNGIEHHLHIQRTETAVNLMAPAMLIFMSSMDSCNSEAFVSWAWQQMTGRKWKGGHTQKPGSLAVYQNKWSFGNSLASPC